MLSLDASEDFSYREEGGLSQSRFSIATDAFDECSTRLNFTSTAPGNQAISRKPCSRQG